MSSRTIPDADDLIIVNEPVTVPGTSSPEAGARSTKTKRLRRRPIGGALVTLATLSTIAGLALWFVFHALVLTALEERGDQARLYAEFREKLAQATAPLGGNIKRGSSVALLDADIDGLRNVVVVEGTTSRELTRGPGHRRDTALPGQPGDSVIFGRSATYGGPLRSITSLTAGDTITATTAQGVFRYRVDRVRRSGDVIPGLVQGASRLTLVTSESSGWRSGWAPDHLVYVDALLDPTQVKPAPSGRPTRIERASEPMRGDTGGLIPLIFWLQGFVAVSIGLVWAWRRWGRWQTWLAGAPLGIAVLWGTSGAVVRLLPNLI